jgi:hypothetical protein
MLVHTAGQKQADRIHPRIIVGAVVGGLCTGRQVLAIILETRLNPEGEGYFKRNAIPAAQRVPLRRELRAEGADMALLARLAGLTGERGHGIRRPGWHAHQNCGNESGEKANYGYLYLS